MDAPAFEEVFILNLSAAGSWVKPRLAQRATGGQSDSQAEGALECAARSPVTRGAFSQFHTLPPQLWEGMLGEALIIPLAKPSQKVLLMNSMSNI